MAKTYKLYKISFIVKGTGRFPIDQLRYDRAVPRKEIDSLMIEDHFIEKPRVVELLMFSPVKDGPTEDRWRSFGWNVLSKEIILP